MTRWGDRIAIVALVGLLTFLLVMGLGTTNSRLEYAHDELKSYSAIQSGLHRDVLKARAGLLTNYDPLVEHIAAMQPRLDAIAANLDAGERKRYLAPIIRSKRRQEALTEQFKTINALVRNSLSYFGLFSDRLSGRQTEARLAHVVDGLSGAMMRMTLETSGPAADEVNARLAALQRICDTGGCSSDALGLLSHGRLLYRLLPKIDATVRRLVSADRGSATAPLCAHFRAREAAAEQEMFHFRILLYVASLLLLFLVVRWGSALRSHSDTLRSQAALEHAVSLLSTRLIACGSGPISPMVVRGLADLGGAMGAGAVHFYNSRQDSFISWFGNPAHDTDAWPEASKALSRTVDGGDAQIIQLTPSDPRVGAAARAQFRAAGIQSWMCILPANPSLPGNFLALDFPMRRTASRPALLSVLRTAFDSISLAVEHAYVEEERAALEAQVRQARRMETIGAFTSGIAHNFNNLIGAISGYAQMAQSKMKQRNLNTGDADQILFAAERGRMLIEGLLSYGRRPEYQRHPIVFDTLVEQAVGLASAALVPLYRIDFVPADEPLTVNVDALQVQQVILNLCHNAAQAMKTGGVIRVTTARRHVDATIEHLHGAIPPGDYAVATVIDTGGGMDAEVLGRVFEPFFTTRANGNGLGLATAREIVQGLDGFLTLDSQPGKGTEARIWFVPGRQAINNVIPFPKHAMRLRGNGEVVMLVIPNYEALVSAEELIAALGYEPVGFVTAADALSALQEAPDRFDIAVTTEPCTDSCARDFQQGGHVLGISIPRIYASRSLERLQAADLVDSGMQAVVRFPLDASEVAAALHRCLTKGLRTQPA